MRERSILFNGAMVRAILAGEKTQARRVVKLTIGGHVKELGRHRRWHPDDPEATLACPYGQPGDRLWVRETCRFGVHADLWDAVEYKADGAWRKLTDLDEATGWRFGELCGYNSAKWRPSIHMPRWASRLLLEVTEVRVERVQDISEADAIAEGLSESAYHPNPFAALWDSINAKRGYEWAKNPRVWAITFQKLQAEALALAEQEPQIAEIVGTRIHVETTRLDTPEHLEAEQEGK